MKSMPFNANAKLFRMLILLAVFALNGFADEADGQQTQEPLRAMSFNIRMGVAKDGANHWDKRKDLVVSVIEKYKPDVVGTQETFDFQAKYLSDKLTDFSYAGRSRQQDDNGEHCGIFYRTSRFDKLIEGHFWLSESPDQPGSKSWDSSLPRMVTWLKLWDRRNKQSFYLINTHFDHRGGIARTESAKLIRKFISTLPKDSQVVITGDFNAGVNSGPYEALFGDAKNSSTGTRSPVVDTFRKLNPRPDNNEGTFNGFKGTRSGARIDWIATSQGIDILSATIDRTSFENRFPSDHFPVTAEIRLQQKD